MTQRPEIGERGKESVAAVLHFLRHPPRPPRVAVIALVAFAAGAAALAVAFVIAPPRFLVPPASTEAADNYYLNEFVPKYRRDECIVRIDYAYLGPAKSGYEAIFFYEIFRYLARHEPKAALFERRDIPGRALYLMFADQCERRFEIARKVVAHLKAVRPGHFRMAVSRDIIKPGPDTVDSDAPLWIDRPAP